MYIPRYWTTASGRPPSGSPPQVDVRGWSDVSMADAERVALERLAEVIARAEAHGGLQPQRHHYYPRIPLQEPKIGDLSDVSGAVLALITRNRYGADVLNTERVFIADVDVLAWEKHEPGEKRWMGLRGSVETVEAHSAKVDAVLASMHHVSWRTYRTRAGLRVIASGANLPPGSQQSLALLQQLGSDPLYAQLTQTYASYRARLSPKPWRIGVPSLELSTRRPGYEGLADDPQWLAQYDRAAEGFAVCQLVASHGTMIDPDVQRVVALHDEVTKVGASHLPLA